MRKQLINDLYRLFTMKPNIDVFPHVRKDTFTRFCDSRQVIYNRNPDGGVVGVLTWMRYKKNGGSQVAGKGDVQLCQIAVHPDHQKRGVGAMLLSVLIDHTIQLGGKIIGLSVRADNTKAISFYKKYGFQKVGEKEWDEGGVKIPGYVYQYKIKPLCQTKGRTKIPI